MTSAVTSVDETAADPWYASVSFWTGPFTFGLGLLVAVGIGFAWYMLGGFPRDHDTYGSVSVPGQQVLELPEGDVRVNFENDTIGSGDTRSIRDRPQGLAVRILLADGGEEGRAELAVQLDHGRSRPRAVRQSRDPERRQLPNSGDRR
jgi:hypothetical protein